MLRITLSKIKSAWNIAFIPRVLQGDVKYAAQKKITKHTTISSQAKSTNSSSGPTDNSETLNYQQTEECNARNLIEKRERCDRIVNKIFPPGDPLYATPTDKGEFDQKMEHLNDTDAENPLAIDEHKEKITNLYYDTESNNYDTSYDGIAKKCLTAPPKQVDERLLKEFGVKHIPDVECQRPTQSYCSEVLYGKQQVHYNASTRLHNVNSISDLHVNACQAELIQPLLLDSISLYENVEDRSNDADYDAPEDVQLTGDVLNPYQSFTFHDCAYQGDVMLENRNDEESITTGVDKLGSNNLIPPSEMEIETDHSNVRKRVEAAVTNLAIEYQPINAIFGNEYSLYTQSTSGPPGEGPAPGTSHHQAETVVKPQTAISSKMKVEKESNPKNTSISNNQNPNDYDNINRFEVHQPLLSNMQANLFPDNSSSAKEFKEPILTTKTIVSYVEGTFKRPIIEIKIPVYNMKETQQYNEKTSVHFNGTADESVDLNNAKDKGSVSCVKGPNKTQMEMVTNITSSSINGEMPLTENPVSTGLRKDTKEVRHTDTMSSNLEPNLTATGPVPIVAEETESLKELLRKIRERHRLELCRDYYNQMTNVAEGYSKPHTLGPDDACKGKDKSPCPPPPKCPPIEKPCAPKKDPCGAKKDPCKPKNPCAKFLKIFDTISPLRLYFVSDFRNVNYLYRQFSSQPRSRSMNIPPLNTFSATEAEKDVFLARDYEPWIPIPSWPVPKKEKRRPFVCPKDGCRLLPSPPFDPAFKDKPCLTLPKKKCSQSDILEQPVLNCRE